eukprot:SAG22_NODE_443_length_10453_cov_8.799691_4_plen_114_part_00
MENVVAHCGVCLFFQQNTIHEWAFREPTHTRAQVPSRLPPDTVEALELTIRPVLRPPPGFRKERWHRHRSRVHGLVRSRQPAAAGRHALYLQGPRQALHDPRADVGLEEEEQD